MNLRIRVSKAASYKLAGKAPAKSAKPLTKPASKRSKQDNLLRADYVYQWLREQMRLGGFAPGDRLREVELAAQLGVSRTPIREAIRRLASDGLVEGAPSRGVMFIELDKQQVRDIYALRAVLEGAAARLAAQHASEGETALMKELVGAGDGQLNAPEMHGRNNRMLHQAICEAAHNRYLMQALSQLSDTLGILPGTTFQVQGRSLDARKEHLGIIDAIERRDPDEAERLARQHINLAGQVRFRMMFENG
jgi:DNA-binding GntR family transcriptional regulator